MTHRTTIAYLIICLTACGQLGCARLRARDSSYETVKVSPNHDTAKASTLNSEAVQLIRKGKLDEAEHKLKDALVADIDFGPAHNSLGYIYFRKKQYYLAAWEYEFAIQSMGHLASPHANLGMVYEEVDRLDDAINEYSTAFELAPKDPFVIGNLARALMKRDESDPMLPQLLREIMLYDTRVSWKKWAKEKLQVGKYHESDGFPERPSIIDSDYEPLPPTPEELLPFSAPVKASYQQPTSRPQRLPSPM
ncbi:MAG: hypothetical protein KDA87_26080 [Planctomycetales bacterium]|nr:hypothetical protein [Planctomycetales bacterium]